MSIWSAQGFARARASMASDGSMPVIWCPRPASSEVKRPVPQPRSMIVFADSFSACLQKNSLSSPKGLSVSYRATNRGSENSV